MASLQQYQTILYEVQEACKQLSLPIPGGVFDVSGETPLLMGSLANLAGTLLADNYRWQHLQKKWTIPGDSVTTQWPLPTDFASVVDNTGWDVPLGRKCFVLNPQQWAEIENNSTPSSFVPVCRVYQDFMEFMTPPTGNVRFQYKVRNWVIDGETQQTKSFLTKNADVPKFDWLMMVIALKVKWLESKNMNTLAAQSDLNDRYNQLTQKDGTAPTLYLSGSRLADDRLINELNTPANLGF